MKPVGANKDVKLMAEVIRIASCPAFREYEGRMLKDIAAEQAVDMIDITYELLPAYFHPEDAIKPDAVLLHPDLGSYEVKNLAMFSDPFTCNARAN